MLFIFIDETSDYKFKEYFGLSLAVVNSSHYSRIKNDFQNTLLESDWDVANEFKGSCLFSTSKGDTSVSIDSRIDICSKILELNRSKINSRIQFYYVKLNTLKPKIAYLNYLPKLLDKALTKASHKNGKDLVNVYCDYRSDIKADEIFNVISPVLLKYEYTLVENVTLCKSSFHTVGILYADIVGYLYSRIDTIANDSELFENIPKEELLNNGKIKKLQSSTKLLNLIKSFNPFMVKVD